MKASIPARLIVIALCTLCCAVASVAHGQRIAGGSPNSGLVLRKLYPKAGRVEINGPNVGTILNQSYVNTLLLHGGINYFFSETWGFGLEGTFAVNFDKGERDCIESFYNDFDYRIDAECESVYSREQAQADARGNGPTREATPTGNRWNYGPAYVPIREIESMIAATAVWNPVYAKQLLFLSATSYFDLFITLGGGVAFSKYYQKITEFSPGHKVRGPAPAEGDSTDSKLPGTDLSETNPDGIFRYGTEGRPAPQNDTHPFLTVGIGQKYHFLNRVNLKVELRNYTLIATQAGFDSFFTIWGGLGIRF